VNQNQEVITNLLKPIRNHVANSPALVLYQIAQGCQQHTVAGLLFFGNGFGDGNENLDRK